MESNDRNEVVCIKSNEPKPLEDKNNISEIRKFFAEFTGTTFLLFIGSGVGIYTRGDIVPIALTNGFILAILIYIFGNVSGGHFNPSVTIAYFLDKKITLKESIYYIVAQLIGGFLGSLMVALCNRGNFDRLASNQIGDYLIKYKDENNEKIDAWSYISALLCEIFLTTLLVILVSAFEKSASSINPLIVGLSLSTFIFTGFHISGGSMNLVRSLPPAVYEAFAGNSTAIKQIWIYIVGPLIGTFIGHFISKFLL